MKTPGEFYAEARRLQRAIDTRYGRAVLVHARITKAQPTPAWWRLTIATGGWSENERAIAEVNEIWAFITWQAKVAGGLHIWAWGPVPDRVGGRLGHVKVGRKW